MIKPQVTTEMGAKIVKVIVDSMDSHSIVKESVLNKFVEAGLTLKYDSKIAHEDWNKKKSYYAKLLAPNKGVVAIVQLNHRDVFAKEIEKEDLGGSIAAGDWWAFSALSLVSHISTALTNCESDKNGRGSRYYEYLAALVKKYPIS